MKNRTAVSMLSLALLLTSSLATSRPILAAQASEPKDVSKLLVEAKAQAMQLKQDAETMEAYTRSDVTWRSQACISDVVRDDVNAFSRQIAKLQAAAENAQPEQKVLIEKMRPVAYGLVSNTNAVIASLNRGHNCVFDPGYRDSVKKNIELADKLLDLLSEATR